MAVPVSASNPLNVIINGARGRMGQSLVHCAQEDPELRVAAGIDLGDDTGKALDKGDAIIDFTHATVLDSLVPLCVERRKIMVIGTTGHTDGQLELVRNAAKVIPIVMAPNFSMGVNTLFWLTAKATEILGPDYDLEVVEMHHRHKKDAPSGTARRLAEILAQVRELDYAKDTRHGREGMVGERTSTEIGMHALRGGDVVGDHTVIFATNGERVELTHKASSRDSFAKGALRAAKWAAGHPAGLYDMQDVLGLR